MKALKCVFATIMVLWLVFASTAYAAGSSAEKRVSEPSVLRNGDSANETSEYDFIKQLLIDDASISFNPETQTVILIDVSTALSEHLDSLNLYGGTMDEMTKEFLFSFEAKIDGANPEEGAPYYIISKDGSSCEQGTFRFRRDASNRSSYVPVSDITEGQESYIAIPVNIGRSYEVKPCEVFLRFGHFEKEGFDYQDIDSISPVPDSTIDMDGYSGTASSDIAVCDFSYTWDAFTFLEIEMCVANPEIKLMEMGGYALVGDSYAKYLIELKDRETGDTLPLPKDVYFDIGQPAGSYLWMQEDGIVTAPITDCEWTFNEERQQWGYWGIDGTIEVRIPYGYDVRATVWEFGKELGADAYIFSQHPLDDDGFAKPLSGINYFEIEFMPVVDTIRIEKIVDGPTDTEQFEFQATRNMLCAYQSRENGRDVFSQREDYDLPLRNYPYRIYDAETNEEIDPGQVHRTDKDGLFTLRVGEYVLFDTWQLPDDFSEYDDWSYVSDALDSGVELKDRNSYAFEEITDDSMVTSITHIRDGNPTIVDGRAVNECFGGDILNIHNTYEIATSNLSVSKMVSGSAADPTKDFTFTVTLSDTTISGAYGDVTFENGGASFTLRAGESKAIEGLPDGTKYSLMETDAADYTVSYTIDNGEPQSGAAVPEQTLNGNVAIVFHNQLNATATPTVTPTATPSPAPVPTRVPNTFYFSFIKEWGGEPLEDISFTIYNPNGTVKQHRFNRTKISETEWRYEAWFSAGADYYVVETPVNGYKTAYINSGEHADVTDRVYNGGRIINYQVPKTGDNANVALWIGCALAGIVLLGGLAVIVRRKKR